MDFLISRESSLPIHQPLYIVVYALFSPNSSSRILNPQQVFALFLKVLEKQQEAALSAGLIA